MQNNYGTYQPPAQPQQLPMKSGPSGLDYASFGLNLLGQAGNAYGTYLASQQAQKQQEEAMRAYREEQDRQQRLDEQNRQKMVINNAQNAGQYAQGLENATLDSYSPYRRSYGA